MFFILKMTYVLWLKLERLVVMVPLTFEFFADFQRRLQNIQSAITCSKLTIETLEQGRNMFKVNNRDTRTMPVASSVSHLVLVFLLLSLSR